VAGREEPPLVVEGYVGGGSPLVVFLPVAVYGVLLAFCAKTFGPQIADKAPELEMFLEFGAVCIPLGFVTACVLVMRRSLRRCGRVELTAAGARLQRTREFLFWSELEGFRDGESDVVELVRRGRSGSAYVPTVDESARTGVLAFLTERGLKRLES
jgi:hypothetical protein